MKKIFSILLFVTIGINHLHIIDAVLHVSVIGKKENTQAKNTSGDKESEPEKDDKGKEKSGEDEKFYSRDSYFITSQFQLPGKDKLVCFTTKLNPHPYNEDDIQPPRLS